MDEATKLSLINLIRERPELLLELNVALAAVLDEAGLAPDELSQAEVLDALARWLEASGEHDEPGK